MVVAVVVVVDMIVVEAVVAEEEEGVATNPSTTTRTAPTKNLPPTNPNFQVNIEAFLAPRETAQNGSRP